MEPPRLRISIVTPCYNEQDHVVECVTVIGEDQPAHPVADDRIPIG